MAASQVDRPVLFTLRVQSDPKSAAVMEAFGKKMADTQQKIDQATAKSDGMQAAASRRQQADREKAAKAAEKQARDLEKAKEREARAIEKTRQAEARAIETTKRRYESAIEQSKSYGMTA